MNCIMVGTQEVCYKIPRRNMPSIGLGTYPFDNFDVASNIQITTRAGFDLLNLGTTDINGHTAVVLKLNNHESVAKITLPSDIVMKKLHIRLLSQSGGTTNYMEFMPYRIDGHYMVSAEDEVNRIYNTGVTTDVFSSLLLMDTIGQDTVHDLNIGHQIATNTLYVGKAGGMPLSAPDVAFYIET